jgi:hypothetical protein
VNTPAPILPGQTLVKSGQLAALFGVSRATLCRWTNEKPALRGCVFITGFYSVQRLRDVGLLTRDDQASAQVEQEVRCADVG